MSVDQLKKDRQALRVIISDCKSGASTILDQEVGVLERILVFLSGPSAKSLDKIVDDHRIDQHDAEQTVRAIFGDR